jgi:hypothetical protein
MVGAHAKIWVRERRMTAARERGLGRGRKHNIVRLLRVIANLTNSLIRNREGRAPPYWLILLNTSRWYCQLDATGAALE